MTRVDFYVLADRDVFARDRFVCRLACRAVDAGQHVHVHVEDEAASTALDGLLWSYPAHRFLPHAPSGVSDPGIRVTIGCEEPPPAADEVLINLCREVPVFFGRFERVAEVVVDEVKTEARQRYTYYRDRGYPLHDHAIDEWER